MTKKIRGTLEAFFETGTEGIYWSIIEENKIEYDSLNLIENGDFLQVYKNKDYKDIYWKGIIKKDFELNREKVPSNYSSCRQIAGNYYVHWLQKDCDPRFWSDMFALEMCAELEINENASARALFRKNVNK